MFDIIISCLTFTLLKVYVKCMYVMYALLSRTIDPVLMRSRTPEIWAPIHGMQGEFRVTYDIIRCCEPSNYKFSYSAKAHVGTGGIFYVQ